VHHHKVAWVDTTGNVNSRRPYTNFQTITEDTSAGPSSYNAFQINWNRRLGGGFTLLGSYVYSKSMDIAPNDGNEDGLTFKDLGASSAAGWAYEYGKGVCVIWRQGT
jgi:hypothetical protein